MLRILAPFVGVGRSLVRQVRKVMGRDAMFHTRLQSALALAGVLLTAAALASAAMWANREPVFVAVVSPAPAGSASPLPKAGQTYRGGWGPERMTFTIAQPSDKPALNSIVNNPAHGDERNFVQCKAKKSSDRDYADQLIVDDGIVVTVYVYIANSATPPGDPITGLTFRLVGEGRTDDPGVGVILASSNVGPVWDGCQLFADRPLRVSYITDSALLHYDKGGKEGTVSLSTDQVRGRELFRDTGAGAGVAPASLSNFGYVTLDVLVEPQDG